MKSKLRASSIIIESPKENAEIWVHITVQQVVYDGDKIVNLIPQYDYISKPLREFMPDEYTYIDNKGNIVSISGLNVMYIITSVVLKWMEEKYNLTQDDEGNLWLS